MSVRESEPSPKSAPGEGTRRGRREKLPAIIPITLLKRLPITVCGEREFNVKIVVNFSQ